MFHSPRRTLLSCKPAIKLSINVSPRLIIRQITPAAPKFSPSCVGQRDFETASTVGEPPLKRLPNPDSASVSVRRSDGSITSCNIHPTPKANRQKLKKALEELLNQDENNSPNQDFPCTTWVLDKRGDAIHRHLVFKSQHEASQFRTELLAAADHLRHHPHITGEVALTVSCTTHNPRGLSMRDAKLAWKVDDLASKHHVKNSAADIPASLLEQMKAQQEINRHAIDDALEKQTGSCFSPGKSAANN